MKTHHTQEFKKMLEYYTRKLEAGNFDEGDAVLVALEAGNIYSEIVQHNRLNPSNCTESCKVTPKSIYAELPHFELMEAVENTKARRLLITPGEL